MARCVWVSVIGLGPSSMVAAGRTPRLIPGRRRPSASPPRRSRRPLTVTCRAAAAEHRMRGYAQASHDSQTIRSEKPATRGQRPLPSGMETAGSQASHCALASRRGPSAQRNAPSPARVYPHGRWARISADSWIGPAPGNRPRAATRRRTAKHTGDRHQAGQSRGSRRRPGAGPLRCPGH